MPEIREVHYRHHHVLELAFTDGLRGEVDLGALLEGPMLAPLQDESLFAQAFVDAELGTVCWPNGADVAPEFLYASLVNRRVVAEREGKRHQ